MKTTPLCIFLGNAAFSLSGVCTWVWRAPTEWPCSTGNSCQEAGAMSWGVERVRPSGRWWLWVAIRADSGLMKWGGLSWGGLPLFTQKYSVPLRYRQHHPQGRGPKLLFTKKAIDDIPPPLAPAWDGIVTKLHLWCGPGTWLQPAWYPGLLHWRSPTLNGKSREHQKHCPFLLFLWAKLGFTGIKPTLGWASLVAQLVKNPPTMRETWVWSLDWEDSPREGKGYPL